MIQPDDAAGQAGELQHMDIIIELLPLICLMLTTGIVGGILAGLLGVGGGIVIVPVLEFALGLNGVDPAIRMHVAVATSLAIIIPTSISSSRAHNVKGAVDFRLIKRWGLPIFVGSVVGTLLAAKVGSAVLAAIFAVVALLVAIKMILPLEDKTLAKDVPSGLLGPILPVSIGALSSMMGIGGGTLSVPVLTLLSQPVHRAVGTAALIGLLISLPGALGYVLTGWNDLRVPAGSFGYVNLIGFVCIAPVTVQAAPIGARIAHKLTQRQLSMAFGSFLFLVAMRMIYRATLGA